jgi:hypothetical protein
LLQPLLYLDHFYQESYEQLQNLVIRHAKRGFYLLDRYSRLYTNHYLSPLHLFCLVHICDTVVRYDDSDEARRTEYIHYCFTSLEQAKVGYPLAGPLQKMFRTALSDYKVSVSDELEGIIGASARLGPEELLEACTRESYVQPVLQIVPNMETRLGQDFMDGYHQQYESRTVEQSQEERSSGTARGKQKRVEIGALLNQ